MRILVGFWLDLPNKSKKVQQERKSVSGASIRKLLVRDFQEEETRPYGGKRPCQTTGLSGGGGPQERVGERAGE